MISLLYSYHKYLGICRIHPGFLGCATILDFMIIRSFLSNFLILLIAHCCLVVCVQREGAQLLGPTPLRCLKSGLLLSFSTCKRKKKTRKILKSFFFFKLFPLFVRIVFSSNSLVFFFLYKVFSLNAFVFPFLCTSST